jgi:hypothetical protein
MKYVLLACITVAGFAATLNAQDHAPTSPAQPELTCEQINTEAAALSTRLGAEQKTQQSAKLADERKAGAQKKRSLLLGPLGSMLTSRKKPVQPDAASVSSDQKRMDELVALSSRRGC